MSSNICTNCGSSATERSNSDSSCTYYCRSCREYFKPYVAQTIAPLRASTAPNPQSPSFLAQANVSVGTKIFDENIDKVLIITGASKSGSSNGSGFILSGYGYIITNAHVVLSKDGDITVPYDVIVGKFDSDSTTYELLLIDYDEERDLALLRFIGKPEKFGSVVLTGKATPKVGEEVYAIGNAKARGISMTKGIVSSAHDRVAKNDYIRIDNAINGGNSGGPAFSSSGALIGVVTFCLKDAVGMSYIIPTATVVDFLDIQIKEYDLKIF